MTGGKDKSLGYQDSWHEIEETNKQKFNFFSLAPPFVEASDSDAVLREKRHFNGKMERSPFDNGNVVN